MNRRQFIAEGCAFCAALFAATVRAQEPWQVPARFNRPDVATDEGGIWAIMDREETRLRRSPFVIRDRTMHDYIQDIACRLGDKHCLDIRVYLVRTPLFNASMAPNGMMQVWTGLMLRMENEAQLAAVLGHEIGHYLERHALERLRDAKSATAFSTFISIFGLVGLAGQLATLATMFGFSRDQERVADRIGVTLMHNAGYDAGEASKVWANLIAEVNARPDDKRTSNPMFATHPGADERSITLAELASGLSGGVRNAETWQERIQPFRHEWLTEEIKRGQYEESIVLFTRMIQAASGQADLLTARGEVYRRRGTDKDIAIAIADFQAAASMGHEPPEAHRGLAMIYRRRNMLSEARASFLRYLELAPGAPDAAMVRNYLKELE